MAWPPLQVSGRGEAFFGLATWFWLEFWKLAFYEENALFVFPCLRGLMLSVRCLSFLGVGLKWGPPQRAQTHSVLGTTITYSIYSTGTLPLKLNPSTALLSSLILNAASLILKAGPRQVDCWTHRRGKQQEIRERGLSRALLAPLSSNKDTRHYSTVIKSSVSS